MKSTPRSRVGILYGGPSQEHSISVITALQAMEALDPYTYEIIPVYLALNGSWYTGEPLWNKAIYKNFNGRDPDITRVILPADPSFRGLIPLNRGYLRRRAPIPLDVCLCLFHGSGGEDGAVQGLLDLAGIPYTGSGVAASALAMDKLASKLFLAEQGLPTLPGYSVTREEARSSFARLTQDVVLKPGLESFPLFIKPRNLGSSIGVAVARDLPELQVALAKAFAVADEALIEPYIENLMEINVSILEGKPPRTSVVEVPISSGGGFLSYDDKYVRRGNKNSPSEEGMASLTRKIDPPELPSSLKEEAKAYATAAFSLLRCRGVARIDFLYDLNAEKLYFNEINPIPGSMAFYLWEQSSPPLLYTELLHYLIQRAIDY